MKLQITFFFFYAGFIFCKKLLNLKGNIFDEQNNIPFATISSYKIYRIKYTTQSQADGYYEFNQLQPADDYETRITFEGFRPLVWMLFRFNWKIKN
jgi:hypothetical protein